MIFGLLPPPLGQAGKYGPPFADPALQRTYNDEWRKLAKDVFITEGTAKSLVASVINATLAAVDARIPDIEQRVRAEATAAVRAEIPNIERQVRAAAITAAPELERRLREIAADVVRKEAEKGARVGFAKMGLLVGMAGVAGYGLVIALRAR